MIFSNKNSPDRDHTDPTPDQTAFVPARGVFVLNAVLWYAIKRVFGPFICSLALEKSSVEIIIILYFRKTIHTAKATRVRLLTEPLSCQLAACCFVMQCYGVYLGTSSPISSVAGLWRKQQMK